MSIIIEYLYFIVEQSSNGKITSIVNVSGHVNGADAGIDADVAEMSAIGHDERLVVVEKFTGGRPRFVVHIEALGGVIVHKIIQHLISICILYTVTIGIWHRIR